MKNTEKRMLRHVVANIVLLIAAIFGILLTSQQENYARQMVQIKEYISELSGRTSQHISDVFRDKKDAINSIAYLYGYPSDTLLMSRNGEVLGRYIDEQTVNALKAEEITDFVSEREREDVIRALNQGEQISFSFNGSEGKSVGSLILVTDTDWMLVQLFPSEATRQIVDEVNADERFVMLLFGLVTAIFVVHLMYVVRKRAMIERDREANERVSRQLGWKRDPGNLAEPWQVIGIPGSHTAGYCISG